MADDGDAGVDGFERQLATMVEREPVVRAWVRRRPPDQIRAALAAAPDGPLRGWTLGVKDVIDTADLPTERGSPLHAGRIPGLDAACVALARRAGAVVVGKTTTSELALFTPTVTTNPHDRARTPGGSSAGSAAAVAAGMVRAALGTQTVGSVLRPAAYCGVVGMKPTHGAVPVAGVAALASSFDTVGWMTTTVVDAGRLLHVLTGAPILPLSERTLRVGRYRSHQWPAARPELTELFDRAAARLAAAGVEVVDIEPLAHLDGAWEAADVVFRHEAAWTLTWERAHPDALDRRIATLLDRADAVTFAEHAEARRRLAEARHRHDHYLASAGLDALLTPSAPGEAPGLDTTGDSVFNRTWTSLGLPAVQLPAGTGPNRLPLGVQLTGRAWADPELLAVATRIEQILGGTDR